LSNRDREKRLELYSEKKPTEVLKVNIQINDEEGEILIFRGFSSYLSQATPYDPDVCLIPEQADIVSIDFLESPYDPINPKYIQKGLSWSQVEELFRQINV